MNKNLKHRDLYFRTVLFQTEELMSAADFAAVQQFVVGKLIAADMVFVAEMQQTKHYPWAIQMQRPAVKQVVFQFKDLPKTEQRAAMNVLLLRFDYIKPKLMRDIVWGKDSYINIIYTKYPRGNYLVEFALERYTKVAETIRQNNEEELKREKLAEKRREEIRLCPLPRTRKLRAKPIKSLSTHLALELVEKNKIA